MDVVSDTGQQREDDNSGPLTLSVMTTKVDEAALVPSSSNRQKGEEEDHLPCIIMPSNPEGPINSSASDVETFNGKIVYNPDGSAYLIEGVDSELSDDWYSLDLLSSANNSRDGVRPGQVVKALHIARHPSFLPYGGTLLQESIHKVPDIRVMHSYRVFTPKERDGVPLDLDPTSRSVWDCGTVPIKPILMCFICKLSFGFTKSLVSHATGEHSLSLNEAQKELVSRKNISAVIQGVGAEPLFSFLQLIPPTSSTRQKVSGENCIGVVRTSFPVSTTKHGSVSSSSSLAIQFKDEASTAMMSTCPVAPVPELTAAATSSSSEVATTTTTPASSSLSSSGFIDTSLPDLQDLAHNEKLAQAAAVSVPDNTGHPPWNAKSSSSPTVTNVVRNTDRMPNSLSSTAEIASNINYHHQHDQNPLLNIGMRVQDVGVVNVSAFQSSTNQSPSPTTPLQQQQQQQHSQTSSSPSSAGLAVASSNAASEVLKNAQLASKQKATRRCDVCNYETNVARNFRIHMTSEKHTHNIMALQHNMKRMQHLSAMQQVQVLQPTLFHPGLMRTPDDQLQYDAAITRLIYNHAPFMRAKRQQRALATKHHTASTLPKRSPAPIVQLLMDPTMGPGAPWEDAFKLYRCNVCNVYSSNSLESLTQHVRRDRSWLREEEMLTHVQGSLLCKLCSYKTDDKAEFRLHRKTKQHRQRARRINHVKEGGPENHWKLMHLDVSNPVQVCCNACGYLTTSLRELRLHVKNPSHDADARVFLFLDRSDSAIRAERKSYHCLMCKVSRRTKFHLAQHILTWGHSRAFKHRKLQVEGELDLKEVFLIKEYKQLTEKTNEDDRENKPLDNYNDMRASPDEKVKDGSMKNSDTSTLTQALLDHSASVPDSSQKHVDVAHCDRTKEVDQYRASLMNNPILYAKGMLGNVLDSHDEELLKKECPEEIDDLPDETIILLHDSDGIIEDGSETKEQQALGDYIDSQTMAEDSYNDPNRKYKCHRCKVAFTRQSDLKSHSKTLLHREVEKKSYPMEKYLDPDLPFKCEVCKESFTKKNMLLIHYTSVSHLSKLKLSMKETNSDGTSANQQKQSVDAQLDHNCPSVERSDSEPPSEPRQAKSSDVPKRSSDATCVSTSATTVTLASKLAETKPFPVAATSSTATNPSLNSSQSTFPLHSDQNSIMQRTLGLLPPESLSAEALIQHQQLYCMFAQSQYPPPPMHNLQTSNSQNIIPSLSHSQKQMEKDGPREKQPRPSLGHPETSASPVVQLNHSSSQRNPTPGQQMFKSRFPDFRLKPLMFRHLLERFGFDVVMQFNENSQRRPRKEADKKDEQAENGSQKSEQEDKENQKIDLPEIKRSVCQKCGKVFSSIWVLKAHQEETHKDFVPIEAVVEKFAQVFREDYERRNTAISNVDDATNMAEAPSSSSRGELSTNASSTQVNQSVDTSRPVMNATTPPVTSLRSHMPDEAFSLTANHMAAQMQFNQLLMSMGQGMGLPMHINMNLPFPVAINMRPPLIPLMMPPSIDPLMASAFSHPMMPGAAVHPNNFAAQQKLLQQQQLSQQQKRSKTRINEDQLKILRTYFDIDAAPTEEKLLEMSEKSGQPVKVIKHWFRNTLFRERQRNTDSLYNFNNPPIDLLEC